MCRIDLINRIGVTRIKICGITRLSDALAAVDAGVDALGFVFYHPSPRYIDPAIASEIVNQLPPFVTIVGLFLDAPGDWVQEVMQLVDLDLLQFHGHESPQECRLAGHPYLKVIGMATHEDPLGYAAKYKGARGFLLDSHDQGKAGGTGQVFDWDDIPSKWPAPIVLAGGLNPDNVRDAINRVHPYAIDVSSGVELAPGIKDPSKIIRLVKEVRRVDA